MFSLRISLHVAQLVPLSVLGFVDNARMLTHPDDSFSSAFSRLKNIFTSHQAAYSHFNEKLYMVGELWDALVNMTSLHIINPDGAYDGQQRSREDFQFDLENVLTMSQLVGKSAEERNAASVMLDILAGTMHETAAEVAVEIVTEAPRISGQKVLCAVLAAKTAGRAKVIVREHATKNGACA